MVIAIVTLNLNVQSALCLFNYNIGPFTFVSGECVFEVIG